MRSVTDGRVRSQTIFLRQQFLQEDGLPFGEVLTSETLSRALATISCDWLDRIYAPLMTLRIFLWQVLSVDHSCRAAVARLIAHRVSQGQSDQLPRSQARQIRVRSLLFSDSISNETVFVLVIHGRLLVQADGQEVEKSNRVGRRRIAPLRKPTQEKAITTLIGIASRL